MIVVEDLWCMNVCYSFVCSVDLYFPRWIDQSAATKTLFLAFAESEYEGDVGK